MKRIESRSNELIKRLRAISHGHPARDETLAVLEGEHLVRAWLDAGCACVHLLVDEHALGHDAQVIACLQRAARQAHVHAVCVPTDVMSAMSSLESPPTIVASVTTRHAGVDALRGHDCIVLDHVQDPGNLGTMLRTAAAAGIRHALLSDGCASAWSPKVVRAGMGAHAAIAIAHSASLRDDVRSLDVRTVGTVLDARADLYDLDLRKPCAWVFGHEGRGVSPEVAAVLDERVRIPQAATVQSLNVAAAAAVCLFEMNRQRSFDGTR